MVWVVVCWLRCWGECRGFAQLREGSDDPPPPVRIGASAALADATPKPASRLIRTVIIAMMRRRRETRCMKPKPLHQTPSGANTACLRKFYLSESRAVCQRQSCIGLQEPWRKPAVFSTSPAFHPTTQPTDNTRASFNCPAAKISLARGGWLFTVLMPGRGTQTEAGLTRDRVTFGKPAIFLSLLDRGIVCMSAFRSR